MSNVKITFSARASKVLSGLENSMPVSVKGIPIGGQMQTPAQAEQSIQAYLDADAAVQTQKTALKAALAVRKAKLASARVVFACVVAYVKALFAGNATVLAAFGIVEKPRAKLSAHSASIRLAKRKATIAKKKAAVPVPATEQVVVYGTDGQPIGGGAAPAASSSTPEPLPSGAGAASAK